jgi:cytochrome c-type biogenesis protein CcmH/NrfG
LAPQDADARCMLAEQLLRQGKFEQAIAEYEESLKIKPGNKKAQVGLEKARAMQDSKGQQQ